MQASVSDFQFRMDANILMDIAILQLNESLHFNEHVRNALLPETNAKFKDGCYATGWGQFQEGICYTILFFC